VIIWKGSQPRRGGAFIDWLAVPAEAEIKRLSITDKNESCTLSRIGIRASSLFSYIIDLIEDRRRREP
jgi:hypothetical protein